MVLELNWDALVSKHAAALISSLTTRREKMEEVIHSAAEESEGNHKTQIDEVVQKCRTLYGELKDQGDKMIEEWKKLSAPATEEAYQTEQKKLIEERNSLMVSKSFPHDGKAQLFKDKITGLSD